MMICRSDSSDFQGELIDWWGTEGQKRCAPKGQVVTLVMVLSKNVEFLLAEKTEISVRLKIQDTLRGKLNLLKVGSILSHYSNRDVDKVSTE